MCGAEKAPTKGKYSNQGPHHFLIRKMCSDGEAQRDKYFIVFTQAVCCVCSLNSRTVFAILESMTVFEVISQVQASFGHACSHC